MLLQPANVLIIRKATAHSLVPGDGADSAQLLQLLTDAIQNRAIQNTIICCTFSDCTTGPRKWLISGCYRLDKYYSTRPEAQQIKKQVGA